MKKLKLRTGNWLVQGHQLLGDAVGMGTQAPWTQGHAHNHNISLLLTWPRETDDVLLLKPLTGSSSKLSWRADRVFQIL